MQNSPDPSILLLILALFIVVCLTIADHVVAYWFVYIITHVLYTEFVLMHSDRVRCGYIS